MRPTTPTHPAWDIGLPSNENIIEAMSTGSLDDCILSARGFYITRRTLMRLQWPATSTAQYLDTSIVDTYLAILNEHTNAIAAGLAAQGSCTRMHIVSTSITLKFFPTAYGPHDLDSVRNLSALSNIPLPELDLLIFPLNPRGTEHWWSVVFDFTAHTINIHNSSPTPSRNTAKYTRALKILVAELFTTYHHPIWSWETWTTIGPDTSPKQANAYDCGVFLCMTITHLSMRAPITFTQQEMPQYRQHIARRLLANTYCRSDAEDHMTSPENARANTPTESPCTGTREHHTPQGKNQTTAQKYDPKNKHLTPRHPPPQNSVKSQQNSKKQRQRQKHAATHRPLSPVHLAPLPRTPQAPETTSTHSQITPNTLTPTPHSPPHGGDSAGGQACSPKREDRRTVRDERRETTTTNPTVIATNRVIDFGEPSSPSASSAAAYTRRHTHPG